ncbi:MAG: GNAT family N-acetyltransferase [Pseudomonas sp.]|uniref:GNAT family N-acetyltransferase n=1 Tax=Pseudomonas sp. TaxID=306 RepID=UPI003390BA79
MPNAALTFRPITAADQAFLQSLYASARAAEMAASGWPAATIAAFLAQQFSLQHRYYQEHFADGEFWLIERAGQAMGRLYLFWGETTLQLIDITLLPEHRGAGLGTALLGELLARADAQGLAVGLHVERHNPALRLYLRLGFAAVAQGDIYLELRRPAVSRARNPSSAATACTP